MNSFSQTEIMDIQTLRELHAQSLVLANQVFELHGQSDTDAFLEALDQYTDIRRSMTAADPGAASRYGAYEAWHVTQFGLGETPAAQDFLKDYPASL
jgi:hypothetical protein